MLWILSVTLLQGGSLSWTIIAVRVGDFSMRKVGGMMRSKACGACAAGYMTCHTRVAHWSMTFPYNEHYKGQT